MKKNFKLISTSLLLLCIGIFGCEKQENSSKNDLLANAITQQVDCMPQNPAIPIDSTGSIHNEALVYLESLELENDLTPVQHAMHLNDFFGSRWGDEYVLEQAFFENIESTITQVHQDGLGSVLSNTGIEGVVKHMLDSISIFNESAMESGNFYCDSALPIILQFENNVQNSSSYTDIEKQSFYAASSTLRHSLYYWIEHYKSVNLKSKGSVALSDEEDQSGALFVALMDALGAYLGARDAIGSLKFGQVVNRAIEVGSAFSDIAVFFVREWL